MNWTFICRLAALFLILFSLFVKSNCLHASNKNLTYLQNHSIDNNSDENIITDHDTIIKKRRKQSFGIGFLSSTLFSTQIDQLFFPGFNVTSTWINPELLLELRGRFTFGNIDTYQFEAAGFRNVYSSKADFFVGGGLGYGGMNLKETLVFFDMSGVPFAGTFYHNGNGIHAFLGASAWFHKKSIFSIKTDIDYFLGLYNVKDIHTPVGVRLTITFMLHAP